MILPSECEPPYAQIVSSASNARPPRDDPQHWRPSPRCGRPSKPELALWPCTCTLSQILTLLGSQQVDVAHHKAWQALFGPCRQQGRLCCQRWLFLEPQACPEYSISSGSSLMLPCMRHSFRPCPWCLHEPLMILLKAKFLKLGSPLSRTCTSALLLDSRLRAS